MLPIPSQSSFNQRHTVLATVQYTHDTSTRVVSVTVWFVVSGREAPGGYPLT